MEKAADIGILAEMGGAGVSEKQHGQQEVGLEWKMEMMGLTSGQGQHRGNYMVEMADTSC